MSTSVAPSRDQSAMSDNAQGQQPKSQTLFTVVDIGCIECGESTNVLGIYPTREEAEAAHSEGEYFDGGQDSVEIFEAPFFPTKSLIDQTLDYLATLEELEAAKAYGPNYVLGAFSDEPEIEE